jgi:hypothetical protein
LLSIECPAVEKEGEEFVGGQPGGEQELEIQDSRARPLHARIDDREWRGASRLSERHSA